MAYRTKGNAKVVAVIGSLAVLAGGATAVAATSSSSGSRSGHVASAALGSTGQSGPAALTSSEQTALESVQAAIKSEIPSIATPVLDKAVAAGTITSAQEQTLLALIENGPGAGGGPGGGMGGHPGGPPPSAG